MFNSALMYELGVLKTFAEPLLMEIDNSTVEYSEARRLIEFLSYFLPIDARTFPPIPSSGSSSAEAASIEEPFHWHI